MHNHLIDIFIFVNRAIFGVLAALCLLGTTLEILLGLKIPSDSAANKSKDCTIAYERNGCASSEHTKLHSLNVESTIHDDDDVQSLLRDEENVQKSVSGSRRLIRKAGKVTPDLTAFTFPPK